MEEVGIVREIKGAMAVVSVQRQATGCDKCPAGSVCKSSGPDENVVEALNSADARVGDTVKIAFRPYTYLKGASLVYGVPALMLVVGAVIGKEYLSRILPAIDPDLASAIGGFGLFLLSFLAIRLFAKHIEGKKEYIPIIEKVIRG